MNNMLKSLVYILSLVIFAMGMTNVANAEEYRQHGTHEHGLAQMNLAVDDQDVHIELISPAANIVGFEHQPKTPEQEAAVKKALETLEDGEALFVFSPDAACDLVEARVETSLMNHHEDDSHDDRDDDEDHEHEGHSEFEGSYQFACKKAKKLAGIDVKLFSIFPGMERIAVQALTDSGQLAVELSPKQMRIEL